MWADERGSVLLPFPLRPRLMNVKLQKLAYLLLTSVTARPGVHYLIPIQKPLIKSNKEGEYLKYHCFSELWHMRYDRDKTSGI